MEDIRRGAEAAAEVEAPTHQRSGIPVRPINEVHREAARSDAAQTSLEEYKVSLRRYAPVQKGLAGLPWSGEWHCVKCGENAPGKLLHEPAEDTIFLELECERCGTWRERHHDILFTRYTPPGTHPRQPTETRSGFPIRLHPDFFRIVRKANEMGFTHVQIASNGILMSEPEFARKAAEAGLHAVYLQFDGVAAIDARGPDARVTRWDMAKLFWVFLKSYQWGARDLRITPLGFMRALRSMTLKKLPALRRVNARPLEG